MNDDLVPLRRELHRTAELSGREVETARSIRARLEATRPDAIVTELGGHGLAAVYEGPESGRTVLLRADLDALPLDDDPRFEHTSKTPGVAHLCGHDGHMATLIGVARAFASQRPARGRVVLLFQPAEETGAGAHAVLRAAGFAPLRPDVVFAQHNLPGFPLGSVVVRRGVFASASCGMIASFEGRTSHAAEPHLGRTPVPAIAALAQVLASLPQQASALHEAAQVTVVGLEAGGPAFGTSPGSGRVMATLRAHDDAVMRRLMDRARDHAHDLARAHGLQCRVEWIEEFPATVNDAGCVDLVVRTARDLGLEVIEHEQPFAWSEDFGHFTAHHRGALFGLGAGEEQPALHAPGYDFPDALLDPGYRLLTALADATLTQDPEAP